VGASRVVRRASYAVRRASCVGVLALVAGCAMRSDVVRIERQLQAGQQQNHRADSLLAGNVAGLARLIQSIADSLAAQQVALAQVRGDTRVELFNIQQQLVAIQELTGQSQQRLSELRTQLEGRRGAVGESAPPAAPVAAASPAPAAGEPTAEQLMDLSVQQLRRGSPGTARAGLAEFLRRFPGHSRTADALFFTGEAWAADQRADSSAVAYRAVVQRFPQSSRAASSLYKLGLQALTAGRTAEARDAFSRVVGSYPNAEEASLARERLRTLPAR
jgi:tol-pal system protein YbgF